MGPKALRFHLVQPTSISDTLYSFSSNFKDTNCWFRQKSCDSQCYTCIKGYKQESTVNSYANTTNHLCILNDNVRVADPLNAHNFEGNYADHNEMYTIYSILVVDYLRGHQEGHVSQLL